MKILQMPSVRGASMQALPRCSWEVLVSRSCRSSPAAASHFLMVLWDSLRGPGMQILVMVFYNSLPETLVEILVKSSKRSLHDRAQVLVRRSCGDPVEIILKRPLH